MPERNSYEYAVIRVVPHVEREEFINAGVILFCRARHFLDARIKLDLARLAVLAPAFDTREAQAHLDLIPRICAGGADAGDLAGLDQEERFFWMISPRSTVVQVSPAHSGMCDDPRTELDKLFKQMVG